MAISDGAALNRWRLVLGKQAETGLPWMCSGPSCFLSLETGVSGTS